MIKWGLIVCDFIEKFVYVWTALEMIEIVFS